MSSASHLLSTTNSSVNTTVDATALNTNAASTNSTDKRKRNKSKQNLAQWMEDQLNSMQSTGGNWVDKSEGIFCIKWKHHKREDWTEADGLIYKEWAIHKGRFVEGRDEPNWNKWKLNLRCALAKRKDIETLDDRNNDDYKFYRFVSLPSSGSTDHTLQGSTSNLHAGSFEMSHSSPQPPVSQTLEGNIPAFIPVALKMEEPTAEMCYKDRLGELSSDLQQMSLGDDMKNLVIDNITDISMDSNFSFPNCIDMESLKDSLKDISQQQACQPGQPNQIINNDPEMTLILRYWSTVVMTKTVSYPAGCRVFYGALTPPDSWNPELFGTYAALQLQIPDVPVGLLTSENEMKQASRMLNALQLGISIFMYGGNIYILRRCLASVYVKANHLPNRQAVKVERDGNLVKIFDFWENFVPAFKLSQEKQGPPPSPFAVISFGQNILADCEEPYANLFLSLTVRHALADQMLSKCVPESAAVEIPSSCEIDKFLEELDLDSILSL